MTSATSRTSLGEYCAARDENTISFAAPAYRRSHLICTTSFFIGLLLAFGWLIVYGVLIDPPKNMHSWTFLAFFVSVFALFSLYMALGSYRNTGVNKITFDLERRFYDRIVCDAAPALPSGDEGLYGMGDPYRQRTVTGSMGEITGIRIMTRRMGGGKASKYHGYSLNLMWRNAKQPPMIIGFALGEGEAWDLAAQISETLDLPVLQIDRTNSWVTLAGETRLQTTNPMPVNILSASRPRSASQNVAGFFPTVTRRKTSPRNVYLAQFDGKTAVFRRPPKQIILNLSLGTFFYAIPVVLTILHLEQWKTYDVPTLIMAVPLVLLGSILIFSSGRSEIAFDLEQRTYRRRLLPKFPGATEDIVGGGLPLHHQVVVGSMDEIEGIKVLARETSNYSHCAVRLIWADNAQPPCVVCYTRNRQDANTQALEIGSLLGLPIILSRKPVPEPDVSVAPKKYNRW